MLGCGVLYRSGLLQSRGIIYYSASRYRTRGTVDVKKQIRLQHRSKLSPTIYMTIYKSTNLQAVNIKTLKSSNRSNKLMFAYLLNTD